MYTLELLNFIVERDGASIRETYTNPKRDQQIQFICSCGQAGSKSFRCANVNGGLFCTDCTKRAYVQKRKTTNLQLYGVENPSQRPEIKQAKTDRAMERYGVSCVLIAKEVVDKIAETNKEKYGTQNVFASEEIKVRIKKSMKEKYGVEHPSQCQELQEKKKQTFMERFGCEHSSQDPAIMSKVKAASFRKKAYTMPSGSIIYVQGYEPYALDTLLNVNHILEEDILHGEQNVPEIWYQFGGKKHRYFTDFFLPKTNTCIEVKSTWTYKKDFEKNVEKHRSTLNTGYNCEFWIYNHITKIFFIIDDIEKHNVCYF